MSKNLERGTESVQNSLRRLTFNIISVPRQGSLQPRLVDTYGKTCTRCGAYKPRTEFYPVRRYGYQKGISVKEVRSMCKECDKTDEAQRRKTRQLTNEQKEAKRAYHRRYWQLKRSKTVEKYSYRWYSNQTKRKGGIN